MVENAEACFQGPKNATPRHFGIEAGDCFFYRAQRRDDAQVSDYRGLTDATVNVAGSRLTIRGKIAGVEVEQIFELPADRPILEERFLVRNRSDARVQLADFEAAFVRSLTDAAGKVLPELAAGRFVAVPFRAKPDDAGGTYNDSPAPI